MAGIADKVRLYNEAYQRAWNGLNIERKRSAGDSARLDAIIRTLIKNGPSSVSDLASEAMRLFVEQEK